MKKIVGIFLILLLILMNIPYVLGGNPPLNDPPECYIDSIIPNPAVHGEEVTIVGKAMDPDGNATYCVPCGDTITEDTTLTDDLLNCPGIGLIIGADNITLDCAGATIDGTGTDYGIYNDGYENVTIKDCIVEDFEYGIYYNNGADNGSIINNNANLNSRYGIYIFNSVNNILANITASDNGDPYGNKIYGIYLDSSSDNVLTNIRTNNNNYGIVLLSSPNNTLVNISESGSWGHGIGIYNSSNNIMTNINASGANVYGIAFWYSSNNNILRNVNTNNCDVGIELDDYSSNNTLTNITISNNFQHGIHLHEYSNNNILTNMNVSSNAGYGILLYFSSNNILANNTISNNDYGIWLYSSSNNNHITGNNISSNNNHGIYLHSSSNNNIFNNLFYNTNNAHDDGNNIWNITKKLGTNIIGGPYLGGNYFSDYSGVDIDGDGIGDTPYNISGGNNKDYLPLADWENQPPNTPVIDGPNSGKPNTEYDYTFNATDPNDNPVMYIVDWGDDNTEWTEYGDSGEEIILKHTWTSQGTYTIKAKAIDIWGAESEWAEFTVTMPRNKATNNVLLLRLLEQFPLLQMLLQRLGLQ